MSSKRIDGSPSTLHTVNTTSHPDIDERLQMPVTLAEVLKVSEAVTRDLLDQVLTGGVQKLRDLAVAQTLHITALTKILTETRITTQSHYIEVLKEVTDEYNKSRSGFLNEDTNTVTGGSEDDIL